MDYLLILRNAANSKQDFIQFLIANEEENAAELVEELWSDQDCRDFFGYWDGDLNRLGTQVFVFDDLLEDKKEALL
jgi:hypothetical protein